MKKHIFFLLSLFSLAIYAQWVELESGVSADFYDVYAVTADTVVVVGSNGTILKTTNGGEQWQQKSSGTSNELRKVQFINATTAYAVGFKGTVLKTIDVGETWEIIDSGTTEDIYGLSVIDKNLFFISGTNGLLQKTLDGGTTWTKMNAPLNETVTAIQFFGESAGFVQVVEKSYDLFFGKLFKTTDDATNWSNVSPANSYISSYYFINESLGFVSMDGRMYKTQNSGESYQNTSTYYYQPVGKIFPVNENILWLTTCDATISNPSFHIYKLDNTSGEGYKTIKSRNLKLFQSIFFANKTNGYAVAKDGAIFKNSTGTMSDMGVDESISKKEDIRVYPNPAQQILNVKLPYKIMNFSLKIIDMEGKTVYSDNFSDKSDVSLNIKKMTKGVYMLHIATTGKIFSQKIIIK